MLCQNQSQIDIQGAEIPKRSQTEDSKRPKIDSRTGLQRQRLVMHGSILATDARINSICIRSVKWMRGAVWINLWRNCKSKSIEIPQRPGKINVWGIGKWDSVRPGEVMQTAGINQLVDELQTELIDMAGYLPRKNTRQISICKGLRIGCLLDCIVF